ncbi:MAG: alanine--glyoxylate aminotransferase family protein [Candidatus Melainabacteria bacterium]|nr:alanine--glyoxylate aminotransferase family protein [Candidatus Melainabacteria bacterium]
MQDKSFLMIPGPTPVPESVLLELAKHPIGHRTEEFSKILLGCTEDLKYVGKTKESDVFIITGSGTSAMESAIASFISPSDKILSLVIGVFGARFAEIANIYGASVEKMEVAPGNIIDLHILEKRLKEDKNKEIKVVTVTHSETSTGAANDLENIAKLVKHHGALLIVDAVTSLCCMNVEIDKWGLDVVVSGSQKGFMIPPGLGFIYVSKKAWEFHKKSTAPKFYLDVGKYKKALDSTKSTPFTPNISFVCALKKALEMIKKEGIENVVSRHNRLKERLRLGVRRIGLKLLVENDKEASSAITAIYPPSGISVADVRKAYAQDWDLKVADGQLDLKGKIFRVGHLGFVSDRDIEMTLTVTEKVMQKLKTNS